MHRGLSLTLLGHDEAWEVPDRQIAGAHVQMLRERTSLGHACAWPS